MSFTTYFAMAVNELVLEGQRFRVARKSLQTICGTFAPTSSPVQEPYHVQSRVDLANFPLFVDAINCGSPNIRPDNGPPPDSLCKEFKFTELGRATESSSRTLSSDRHRIPSESQDFTDGASSLRSVDTQPHFILVHWDERWRTPPSDSTASPGKNKPLHQGGGADKRRPALAGRWKTIGQQPSRLAPTGAVARRSDPSPANTNCHAAHTVALRPSRRVLGPSTVLEQAPLLPGHRRRNISPSPAQS
jgi:hypothetical protein